ncbi:MAG: hypothetical protein ACJA1R_001584 [Flavobacteriales bacterium]
MIASDLDVRCYAHARELPVRPTVLKRNLSTLFLVLLCAACGGDSTDNSADPDAGPGDAGNDTHPGIDGGDGGPGGDAGGLVIPDNLPREPGTTAVCRIDLDCESGSHCFNNLCSRECSEDIACEDGATCDDRGRCGSDNKMVDEPTELVDAIFVESPLPEVFVPEGSDGIMVDARLEGDGVPEFLRYRVEDSAGASDSGRVRRAQVGADGSCRFELPISRETIDNTEGERVDVRVSTDAGSFMVTAVQTPTVDGSWSGSARVTEFGTLQLPIAFQIVTVPEGRSLEDADEAWLVLPNGEEWIFSPRPGLESDTTVSRQLEYDGLTERWVAFFRHDVGEIGAVAGRPGVQRSLRFELATDGEREVTGRVVDRWRGLYEQRSSSGVIEPAVVSFEGELLLFRAGDLESDLVWTDDGENDPTTEVSVDLPTLSTCTDEMFVEDNTDTPELEYRSYDADGEVWSCGAPDAGYDVAAFLANAELDPAVSRETCALAIAGDALSSGTTGATILSYIAGDGGGDGRSFAEFIADCASGATDDCRPSPEVLCARELVAYAYVAEEELPVYGDQLIDWFASLSREAFLGRQLGAFETDSATRLSWLQSTDFPAIVTAAVRDHLSNLLEAWVEGVVDVHLAVVEEQFDAAGLAVLSRQPVAADAIARRQELLFEMSQTWRASMDALTLAAQRWHALYVNGADRANATALVAERTLELYVLAGISYNLNLRGGAGFANATFGGGFGALARQVRQLSLPFDELIYARDAEVVVSRSLDPAADNFNLLQRLRTAALEGVAAADESVAGVVATANETALDRETLQNRLSNEINAVRDEIVALCGLQPGCGVDDLDDPECAPRVGAGECGFVFDGPDVSAFQDANASEAGSAVLSIIESNNNVAISMAELDSSQVRGQLAYAATEDFAVELERWNLQRLESINDIDRIVRDNVDAWGGELAGLAQNISERNDARALLLADAQADASQWNSIRISGVNEDFGQLQAALGLERTAAGAQSVGDLAGSGARLMAAGMPRAVGVAVDASAPARAALATKAIMWMSLANVVSAGAEAAAGEVRRVAERDSALRQAELQGLRDQDIADDVALTNEIEVLRDAAELSGSQSELATWEVDRLLEQMQTLAEAELAYQRDVQELRDRRQAAFGLLLDESALSLRVLRAQTAVLQRALEYQRVVQRAGLLEARWHELKTQQANVNALIGSPSVVFAWANRLTQAENRLELAKNGLMEWLVAMEYYAVRPFMDQRIQILLARNPRQLEEIAAEMTRLESVCGGPSNAQSTVVRLSEFIGAADASIDDTSGVVVVPEERLRATLQRGDANVNRRVRISASVSGAELNTRSDLLSATLPIDIEYFANLGLSCNAKIESFDVALIGEGLGDARPTVTIVYDGTSRVRSCQPDLDEYVAQFGPDATAFGPLTTFRSPARAISPVAGINEFPTDSFPQGGNLTLSGLPLAADYTIVIDPTVGENRNIQWNRLDDIELRVNFAYQDFFPRGACQ